MSVVIIWCRVENFSVSFFYMTLFYLYSFVKETGRCAYLSLCNISVKTDTVLLLLSVSILRTLANVSWNWGTDIPNWVAPLDKCFTYILWIFYVQWHHVFVLKINFVLIGYSFIDLGYSFIDLQWAVTRIGWFIIRLINIQLCTLRHTLMVAISNHEMSVFQNNYG